MDDQTRKEFLFELIKMLWGVEMNENCIRFDVIQFKSCDGIACPDGVECENCKYKGFWEGSKYEVL